MAQFTRKITQTNTIQKLLDDNENVNALSKKHLYELSKQINQIKEITLKSILLEKKKMKLFMTKRNTNKIEELIDTDINNTIHTNNVSKYAKMVSILWLAIKNMYIHIEMYAVIPSSKIVIPTINIIKMMFYCICVLFQTTFGQLILVFILINIYRTKFGFLIINYFIQFIFGIDVHAKYASVTELLNRITVIIGCHLTHANATVTELTRDIANVLIQMNNMKTYMVSITGNITNQIENATDIINASVLAGLSSSGIDNLTGQLATILSKEVSLNEYSFNQIQTMLSNLKMDNVKLENAQYLELMVKQTYIMDNIQLLSNKLQNAPELMEQLIISLNQQPNSGDQIELVIQALGNINKVVSFETIFNLINSAGSVNKITNGGRYYKRKN